MARPPIADPSGEIYLSPSVTPGLDFAVLAQCLNPARILIPVCTVFSVLDIPIFSAISDLLQFGCTLPDSVFGGVAGILAIFWFPTRILVGRRLANAVGRPSLLSVTLGLVPDFINILALLSLEKEVTRKLRAAGVNVGLFGVYPREMRKLNTAASSGFAGPNQDG